MATIQENRKNGKLVSSSLPACVRTRDAAGKQIRYYRTWTPPREYAPARARKYAQLEAAQWEQAIRKHGTNSAQVLGSEPLAAQKRPTSAHLSLTHGSPFRYATAARSPKPRTFTKSMTQTDLQVL